MAGAQK